MPAAQCHVAFASPNGSPVGVAGSSNHTGHWLSVVAHVCGAAVGDGAAVGSGSAYSHGPERRIDRENAALGHGPGVVRELARRAAARAAKAQAEAHASSDVDCSELPRPFWVCCCVKGDLSANLQRVAIFNGTAVTEEMIAVVSFDETKIAVDGSAAATATAALPRAHDADLVGGATTCFDSALSRAGTSGHQSRSSLPGHNTNPAELVNF